MLKILLRNRFPPPADRRMSYATIADDAALANFERDRSLNLVL